jgi:hypothetical protein
MTPRSITIARACQILGKSYNQTLRLILLGRLRGWQNNIGRWEVDPQSVERLRRCPSQSKTKGTVIVQDGGAS